MVLNVLMWSLFGMFASFVFSRLHGTLTRRGFLNEHRTRLICRACGIILIAFGLIIAASAVHYGVMAGDISALLYILVGSLLLFAKPLPKPATAPDRRNTARK